MMAPYRPSSPYRRAAPAHPPYGGETQSSAGSRRGETASAAPTAAPTVSTTATTAPAAAAVGAAAEAEGFQSLAVRAVPGPARVEQLAPWERGAVERESEAGGGERGDEEEEEEEEEELRRDFSSGPRNYLETLALQDLLARQSSHKEASLAPSGPAFPAPRTAAPTSAAGAGAGAAVSASTRAPTTAPAAAGAGRYAGASTAPNPWGPSSSASRRPTTADSTLRVPGQPGRSPLRPASPSPSVRPGSRRVDPSMLPAFIPLARATPGSRLTGASPSRAQWGRGREAPGPRRGADRARERRSQVDSVGKEKEGTTGPAVDYTATEWGVGRRETRASAAIGYSDKPLTSTASTGYSDKPLTPTASNGSSDKPITPTASNGYSDKPLAPTASTGYSDKPLAPTASTGYSDKPLAPAGSLGGYSDRVQCRTDSSESASEAEFPWRGDDPDTPSELSLDLSLKSASTESEGVRSHSHRSLRSSASSEREAENDRGLDGKRGGPARRHSTGAPSVAPAVTGGSGGGGGGTPGLAIRRLLGVLAHSPGSGGAPPTPSAGAAPSLPAVTPSTGAHGTPTEALGGAGEGPSAEEERQSLGEEEEKRSSMMAEVREVETPHNPKPPTALSRPSSPLTSLPSASASRTPSEAASENGRAGALSAGAPSEGDQRLEGQALGMPCGMPGAAPCGISSAPTAPGPHSGDAPKAEEPRLSPRLSEEYNRGPQHAPSAPSSPLVSLPSSTSSGAQMAGQQGEKRAPRLSDEYDTSKYSNNRPSSHMPSAPSSPLVRHPSSSTTLSRAETDIYQGSVGYASGAPGWREGPGGSHSPFSSHMGSACGTPGRALGTPGGSIVGGRVASSALVAYSAHAGPLAHPWFTPAGSVPATPSRHAPPPQGNGGATGGLLPSVGRALKAEQRERAQPPIPFSWQQGSELALVPRPGAPAGASGAGDEAGAGGASPGPGRFRNGQGLLVGPPPTRGSGGNGRDEEAANAVVIRDKGPGPGPGPVLGAMAPPAYPVGYPGQLNGQLSAAGGWSGGVLNDLPPRRPAPQFSWSRVEVQATHRPGLYGQGGSLVVGPDKELKRFLRVRAMQMAQPALPMLPAPGSEEAGD